MNFLPFRVLNMVKRCLFRATVAPFFGSYGAGSSILRPRGIEGIRNIHLGANVYISDAALLAAVGHTGQAPRLEISDGCSLGRNNHIYATQNIVLEAGVLTANNVYIADNTHSFMDTEKPILRQPIDQLAPVRIGAGSWLGQNVCVIGASVGRGCVIGAGAVVLSDIPDFSVAVGAPARVIRRADPETKIWAAIDRTQPSNS